MPEVSRMKPIVAKEVFEEMKRAGIRGDKEYLKQYHARRCEADVGSSPNRVDPICDAFLAVDCVAEETPPET